MFKGLLDKKLLISDLLTTVVGVALGEEGSDFTLAAAALGAGLAAASLGAGLAAAALVAALLLAAAFLTAFLAAALAASKLPFLTIAETKEKREAAKEYQVERI